MSELVRLARGAIATGVHGARLDTTLRARLRDGGFGAYVLFGRNVENLAQVRALADDLRALDDPPALVAIDQEGGRVARLHDGVEALPSMMALGATRSAELARRAGEQLGFDLRRAGVTLDFAPVLDLALEPESTVIGMRAFGSDSRETTRLASALADGMRAFGVVPTFKHAPGHGSTALDSHVGLPVVDADAATLRARDFAPFAACAADASAFMTAHVIVRALDAEHPATLSPRILTELFRDEWGFRGCCFTDCMQMDAIARGIGTVEGVLAAIAAGADCATISSDIDLAFAAADRLAEAVERGRLPLARLREANARVMHLRRGAAPPLPLDASPPHPGIGREIARRATTLVRGIAHADPTTALAISFEGARADGVATDARDAASLAVQAPALAMLRLSLDPSEGEVARALDELAASGRRALLLARRAHLHPAQAAAIARIVEREPDAVVVSMQEPFDVACFERARHVLATYGDEAPSVAGLADVLFGGCAPSGVMPVAL
ncbi:MAG: beta-N-acetylhexosaminidase [bacterium]|nr:beta-N-acetylhexosaminidase [bacterium]